jgi:hypothetical protein
MFEGVVLIRGAASMMILSLIIAVLLVLIALYIQYKA